MPDATNDGGGQHRTRQEVTKLPRERCQRCGIAVVATMLERRADERVCRNRTACQKRRAQTAARAAGKA